MTICTICYKSGVICYNFGAKSCKSCAAFFRRTIRLQLEYSCFEDENSCSKFALNEVRVAHACKKCRLDRCFQAGMKTKFVRDPHMVTPPQLHSPMSQIVPIAGPNPELPLLNAMVQVVRCAFQMNPLSTDPNHMLGTSEPEARFLTYNQHKLVILKEYQRFRNLLNFTPVVRDLRGRHKDAIFKNCLFPYIIFASQFSHLRHISMGFSPDKFYLGSNKYLDEKPDALFRFLSSNKSQNSLAGAADIYSFSNFLSTVIIHCKEAICEANTESVERVAIVLMLIIIQGNDFDKSNEEWQRPITKLKEIWKELDIYFKTTHQEPSSWGNLMFFLSNIQTIVEKYQKMTEMVHLYFGDGVPRRLAQAGKPEQALSNMIEEFSS